MSESASALASTAARPAWLKKLDPYLLALLAGEVILYSVGFLAWFSGDSVSVLQFRPKSIVESLATWFQPQSFGFFRPLSQSLIPCILFPLFKNHFAPYHAVSLLGHLLVSWLAYAGQVRIFQQRLVAYIGALFFGFHVIGFYASYDIGFLPETSFTLFYLLAIWFLLDGRRLLSLACFASCLYSKEAGITLPVMVAILIAVVPRLRADWKRHARLLPALLLIAAVYLAPYSKYLVVGGGTVTSWAKSEYALAFDWTMLRNLLRFARRCFQVPDGWATTGWVFAPPYSWVIYIFAIAIVGFALAAAIRGNVIARAGLLGFLITSLPMLPLAHYLPHHPYLPLAGLALIVCGFFLVLQNRVPRPFFLAVAVLFCLNHAWVAWQDSRAELYGSWVGGNGVICRTTAEFVRTHRLDDSSVVYIINEGNVDRAVFAFQDQGLIRFVTSLDGMKTRMVGSAEQVPRPLAPNTVVGLFRHNRLMDVTADYAPAAARAVPASPSDTISIDRTGLLSWNTGKPVQVTVSMDGAPEKLMGEAPAGQGRPEWLFPEHTFRFTLRELRKDGSNQALDWVEYRQGASGAVSIVKPGQAPPPRSVPIPWAAIALLVLLGPLVLFGWRDAAGQQLPAKIAAV
jgi:hypothetical protein